MTTIHFERSGGLTGVPFNIHVDLPEIPEDAAQTMQNILLQSNFHHIPEDLRDGSGAPDEQNYTLRVIAGQSDHTVRFTDSTMPESLAPLVEALRKTDAARRDDHPR